MTSLRQRSSAHPCRRSPACVHPSPSHLLSDAPAPDAGIQPSDTDVGGRLFGRYRVVRPVGVGGFARVYHAIDPDLELDVAVKVLRPELTYDPEVVDRFRREASTAAKLRHPHVITVLTVGRLAEPFDGIPAGAPYLVLDYLPHSLADRLDASGTLPEAEIARIGAEVARGLAYAHRQGIVHRDVKPENVLFARDGRAVVTDFGIARALSAAPSGPSRQVLLGTPAYFSPEQARGLPLDGRSDLYALGVTLYRAATGGVPFAGDDWYVVMRQHIEEIAPPPSSVNPALGAGFDAVVARALAKDPADRYPTGDALADALDALRGRASNRLNTTEIPRIIAAPSTGARARRLRWTAAGLAAAGVAVVGGRVLAVRGTPERLPSQDRSPASSGLRRPAVSAGAGSAAPTAGAAPGGSAARPADGAQTGVVRDSAAVAASSLSTGKNAGRSARAALLRASDSGRSTAGRGSTLGGITVSAPADADIYVDGDAVARGPWRSNIVAAGRHIIRATVGGLPGCSSADTSVTVDVTPNSRHAVALEPVACGRLILDFRARTAPHYTLVPLHGGSGREGLLPLAQPLVLPDGIYRLTVEASACLPYTDPNLPVVAGKTRRELHSLECP